MKKMKIVLCTDDNYAKHAAATIDSIVAHGGRHLDFVILYISLSGGTIETLKNYFQEKTNSFEFIPVDGKMLSNLPKGSFGHISLSTYLRIFIPQALPNDRMALYLDCDMIVRDDIAKLMNADILKTTRKPVYAVEELYAHLPEYAGHKKELGIEDDSPIFNAGMQILDLELWRRNDYISRIMEYIEKNRDILYFSDQDTLNGVFKDDWAPLPVRWNMGDTQFNPACRDRFICYSAAEIEEAAADPALIHFTWIYKPWKYVCRHPYKAEYWTYRRTGPYPTTKQEGLTLKNILRKQWHRLKHR
jgi:lipopolysaccharide biosynthesis glycosyltransferase